MSARRKRGSHPPVIIRAKASAYPLVRSSKRLLPVFEDGYLDGMHQSVGLRVPFRYALVNGWYYNAAPIPSPKLLSPVLWQGRGRAVKILYAPARRDTYPSGRAKSSSR
jgi:hypothetical protein